MEIVPAPGCHRRTMIPGNDPIDPADVRLQGSNTRIICTTSMRENLAAHSTRCPRTQHPPWPAIRDTQRRICRPACLTTTSLPLAEDGIIASLRDTERNLGLHRHCYETNQLTVASFALAHQQLMATTLILFGYYACAGKDEDLFVISPPVNSTRLTTHTRIYAYSCYVGWTLTVL